MMLRYSRASLTIIFACLHTTVVHCLEPPKPQNRIFHGQPARVGQFPYQASLVNAAILTHRCGGAIIGLRRVITAAHCVEFDDDDDYKVTGPEAIAILAGHVRTMDTADPNAVYSSIIQIRIHPRRDARRNRFDSAVVRTAGRLYDGQSWTRAPIRLAGRRTRDYQPCVLSGWGDRENEVESKELRFVRLWKVSDEKCARRWNRTHMKEDIVCAVGLGGRDAGPADSGGPLVCAGVLVGTVQSGQSVPTDIPGWYANISLVRDWAIDGDPTALNDGRVTRRLNGVQMLVVMLAPSFLTRFECFMLKPK